MDFASIGSGSKGNALIVRAGQTAIMVDCGLPYKAVNAGLADLGMSAENLSAIFITHEHGDHIKGLRSLARQCEAAIYMTEGTAYAAGWHNDERVKFVRDGEPVSSGELSVTPVLVPHDAREPCQFIVASGTKKLGVLTDLGSVSTHVIGAYQGCDALVLETNHDIDMLRQGSYPAGLKARVMGDWGHLSNLQAKELLAKIYNDKIQWLVLAHVSQQNNCVRLVKEVMHEVFPFSDRTLVAEQDNGFDWLAIQ